MRIEDLIPGKTYLLQVDGVHGVAEYIRLDTDSGYILLRILFKAPDNWGDPVGDHIFYFDISAVVRLATEIDLLLYD